MFIDGLHEKDIYLEKFPFKLFENTEVDFEYPSHWHNAVEILYMMKNCCKIEINGKEILLDERDILFIAPGDIHGFPKTKNTNTSVFIQFDPAELTGIVTGFPREFYANTVLISASNDKTLHKALQEQIVTLIDEYGNRGPAYQLVLNARIFDIMAILSRSCKGSNLTAGSSKSGKKVHGLEKLNKALEYIEQNYRNEISLAKIAKSTGFSTFHFSRVFKDIMEMNFHDYLKKYRIKKSEKLLSDSSYSITQSAYMSGFNSISTFNRTFKEIKGLTPTNYRKLHMVTIIPNSSILSLE